MNKEIIQTLKNKNLSAEKIDILENIINDLKSIKNIQAIVLGGSYSTGSANKESDLDIGIYYFSKKPFSIENIKEIAEKYDKDNDPTVTDFYEWGCWVNGGAWIHHNNCKIDFLYRNIEQIKETIENANNGKYENDYEQQPPYGFISIIYLAETEYCIPLYDPYDILVELKKEIMKYPKNLKDSVIKKSLWAAEFTILHIEGFYKRNDIFNIMGCITRTLKNLIDTLYAVNEKYLIGYKRAIEEIKKMKKIPNNLRRKIENILSYNENIDNNIKSLKDLFNEIKHLTEDIYKPKYEL